MTKTTKTLMAGMLALSLPLAACVTQDPYTGEQNISNTAAGAGLGAAAGALTGVLLASGKSGKRTRKNALIGAGIGALGGAAIGNYMDNQEAKLRAQLQDTGVSVTRNGDRIILNMPSNVTFDVDRTEVKPQFYAVLDSVGLVFNEFNRTVISIYGHTDSTGNDAYNQDLSEARAISVARFFIERGVDQRRFSVIGYGETQPIASNDTVEGRAANRRVEIEIDPLN